MKRSSGERDRLNFEVVLIDAREPSPVGDRLRRFGYPVVGQLRTVVEVENYRPRIGRQVPVVASDLPDARIVPAALAAWSNWECLVAFGRVSFRALEREIIHQLAAGNTSSIGIAATLHVSPGTVDHALSDIFRLFDMHNRAELAAWAAELAEVISADDDGYDGG